VKLIELDFETYYDQDYSLRKLTTEEYLRDERFEIIGLGIHYRGQECEWLSGTHKQIEDYIKEHYDWENSAVLAHNTMFDGAILDWKFGIKPKLYLDTLSMARAVHGVTVGGSLDYLSKRYKLGQKGTEIINAKGLRRADFTEEGLSAYGDYCIQDVVLCGKLFDVLNKDFPRDELSTIDTTLRMFIEPVFELDQPRLEHHLHKLKTMKEITLSTLKDVCGIDKAQLMSNPKFANALTALGVEPPMKISPRTQKLTYAFSKKDKDFLALEDHPDYRVQTLVGARLKTKSTLEETRTERFIGIAKRGLIPVPIKYYAAHTGRWGGSDKVNFQNLPSRGQHAKALKSCIKAPKGYRIVEADSAQIEARVLAWLAGQEDLLEGFRQGKDVYKEMASRIYGKPVSEITDEERFIGKSTILGAGYNMGGERFKDQMKEFGVDMPLAEATRIIRIYRENNPAIVAFWRTCQVAIEGMVRGDYFQLDTLGVTSVEIKDDIPGVLLPNGLRIPYSNLHAQQGDKGVEYVYKARFGLTRLYGGKMVENICQAIARCIIAKQIQRVQRRERVALTVHDSLLSCVKKDRVDEVAAYIEECMAWVPKWAEGLPVEGEANVGKNYGEVKQWQR